MSSDMAILRRLFGLARPYRGWMGLAGAVACVTVLASIGLMAVAGWFIAAMAIAGVSTGMMNYFLPSAAIRLFAILRTGGRYLERLLSHEATFRLLAGVRLWLFRRLEPLAPADLMDRRGADLASGLQADVETLQHAYLRLGAPVAVAVACAIAVVAILVALHPPTGAAVGLLLVCGGALAPALARRAAAGPGAQAVRLRTELRVAVVDALQGATDLRAAGAQERQRAHVSALSMALIDAQRRTAVSGVLAEAGVGLCAGLALWSAALLSAASVAASDLAPAMVPALSLAALASFEAVAPLPAAMQRWGEVMAAARRLFALADRVPTVVPAVGPSPVPRDGSLEFLSVGLRYSPDGAPALDGLNLVIPSGRRVALLGPSGAGKSSIAKLLLRFWDYEGEIRLGGHDLRLYQPEDLRRMVGVAAQDAQLFNATLRDNLLMAAPEADDAALLQCLALAQLGDVVAHLPEGLDTWIGESGARLSAGQARRLVLARTLLRAPAVLVLDEPTENLDPTTARRLLAALKVATAGRTVILITHDPVAAETFAQDTVRLEAGRRVG
ncbi:thiol reductant ABC exporter subunit CydC [Xanthobacter agilis]|uniref:ATP-binding cassette subfamily C protein CydC n=1 Tax=Xanthobacter agilis TaxID=47492 RepID=A0ABU0L7X0_XANAG|nr:thiol reductant ABC exporter subunit CydC [Xanthobacter agilis]MDQ0503240.1 ATP-binding cassette subfamily C protein CydC [Xanthobacter agilis]